MQKLLQDIDNIVDLSRPETETLIEAFKSFLDRNFVVDPQVLNQTFRIPVSFFLNQQEDEDNFHSMMSKSNFQAA
jgi:hypothetical protein